MLSSGSTSRHLIAHWMTRSTNRRMLGPFARRKRAVRHGVYLIHASLKMPTDVAAYDVAVIVAAYMLERARRPLVVADGELVASR
jgi:hypothetical protein